MARREAEAEWRKRLARWKKFDGTVHAFCKAEGVSDKGFYHWRRRLAPSGAPSDKVELVEIARGGDHGAIEIVIREGIVVRVHGAVDKGVLRGVLDVLTERQ